MDPATRKRLIEATELAYDWHADQKRKGSEIPYISHLLQVQGLVLEHGGDGVQAVAALLHDSLEDAETAEEADERAAEILQRFGEEALAIVRDCSDTGPGEAGANKGPWKERKQRYLRKLAAAPNRSLLVATCDKLHNLNALVWDLEMHGLVYLDHFNAGAAEQLWYYEEMQRLIAGRMPKRLVTELSTLHDRFRSKLT